jgi:hypothetical protein
MALSESLNAQALRELKEIKCAGCGNRKACGNSFCLPCYKKLPLWLQREMYKTFSEGYGEAYSEAKDHLRENS